MIHGTKYLWNSSVVPGHVVLDFVDFVVLRVDGSDEHVVGDVLQVAAELQPGAGRRDVIRRALALHL